MEGQRDQADVVQQGHSLFYHSYIADSDGNEWKQWNPSVILKALPEGQSVVVFLNQPIRDGIVNLVMALWKTAVLRVAVDGGMNRLHAMVDGHAEFVPDVVCGDFDSIQPELLMLYKQKGSIVKHTPDQDFTDFTKALGCIMDITKDKGIVVNNIVAVVKHGGRLDQILANLNTLFLATHMTPVPVVLLSDQCLTWLLGAGRHKILIPTGLRQQTCGLIPLGEPCLCVTTTGLKWNLTNNQMQFGEFISTSNTYEDSGVVTVETDKAIVWTMEYQDLHDSNAS